MTGRLQVKNGKYYMILNIKDERGCRKAKWIKTGLPVQNNRWRAEKMLRDKLRQYEGLGTIVSDSGFDLANWVSNWVEIKKMTLRPNAYQGYKDVVEQHIVPYCKLRKLDLMTVKPADLQDYYSMKVKNGLHPNTLLKHRTVFKGAFDYAYQRQLIFENPMSRVIHPKQQNSLVQFFTNEQLSDILLKIQGNPIESAVYVAVFTGFRRGEIGASLAISRF